MNSNRKRWHWSIATIATLALTATACGSSGDSGKDDTIEGADEKSPSSTPSPASSDEPDPEATAPDGSKRPVIKLPADIKNVFEGEKTGDKTKDAILADNERYINAVDAAVANGNTKDSAIGYYATGEALLSVVDFAKSFIDKDITFTGTISFYERTVEVRNANTATISYCSDESKAGLKDSKTGKLRESGVEGGDGEVITYRKLGVKKNDNGVWRTFSIQIERGAAQCKR